MGYYRGLPGKAPPKDVEIIRPSCKHAGESDAKDHHAADSTPSTSGLPTTSSTPDLKVKSKGKKHKKHSKKHKRRPLISDDDENSSPSKKLNIKVPFQSYVGEGKRKDRKDSSTSEKSKAVTVEVAPQVHSSQSSKPTDVTNAMPLISSSTSAEVQPSDKKKDLSPYLPMGLVVVPGVCTMEMETQTESIEMLDKSLQIGESLSTNSVHVQTEVALGQLMEIEQSWGKFNVARMSFHDKIRLLFSQSIQRETQTDMGGEGSHSGTDDSSSDSEESTSGSSEESSGSSDSQDSDTDDSSSKADKRSWRGF